MVKSPNRSPSSRSRAYRLIIGRNIARMSGSVTDSGVSFQLIDEADNPLTYLDIFCSAVGHSIHRLAASSKRLATFPQTPPLVNQSCQSRVNPLTIRAWSYQQHMDGNSHWDTRSYALRSNRFEDHFLRKFFQPYR